MRISDWSSDVCSSDLLEAHFTGGIPVHAQADVVHAHGGAVIRRTGHRDLELARQEAEFRMEGRPLPDDLAPQARVLDLVMGGAGELVGGGVADGVAAGLDREIGRAHVWTPVTN